MERLFISETRYMKRKMFRKKNKIKLPKELNLLGNTIDKLFKEEWKKKEKLQELYEKDWNKEKSK